MGCPRTPATASRQNSARVIAVLELGALVAAEAAHRVDINDDVAEVHVMVLVRPLIDHNAARFEFARVSVVPVRHGGGVVEGRLVTGRLKNSHTNRRCKDGGVYPSSGG